MISVFGWNVTIVGALVCLAYCWFLSSLGRSQRVRFGKIGPVLGIIGALVLAGMAVAKSINVSKIEGVMVPMVTTNIVETDPDVIKAKQANNEALGLTLRTIRVAGPRPSRDHFPYRDSDRNFKWGSKDDYRTYKRGGK